MAERTQRLIDGPDQDYLTKDETARYLKMHAKTLQRLIDDGEFPQPLKLSPGTLVWSWRDVLYWSLRAELSARMVAEPDRKERKPRRKTKDNEGQTTPSSGQLPGTH